MIRKAGAYLKLGFSLLKAGVTLPSILLYPLRRRRSQSPEGRLKLKSGKSITSPPGEPLAFLFEEIWGQKDYTPAGLEIPSGATVVDIGANVGVFTLWAVMHGAARVIAVEPSPRMHEYLSRNVSSNRLDNVTVVQAACAGRKGEAVLYSRGIEVANTLYCQDALGSTFEELCRTPVATLDDIFKLYEVESCGLLKLDCEGAEYEVLLGASDDVLRRISKITMEYHVGLNEHDPQELERHLRERGFETRKTPLFDPECGYLYAFRRV